MKNTVPAIAEAMESLRGKMLIFRYQLRRANAGKGLLRRHLDAVKPEVKRYTGLVTQIKERSERGNLCLPKRNPHRSCM